MTDIKFIADLFMYIFYAHIINSAKLNTYLLGSLAVATCSRPMNL